jgi:hypothetical protein
MLDPKESPSQLNRPNSATRGTSPPYLAAAAGAAAIRLARSAFAGAGGLAGNQSGKGNSELVAQRLLSLHDVQLSRGLCRAVASHLQK